LNFFKCYGIVDEEMAGKKFFGRDIMPLKAVSGLSYDRIVVTSYLKREKIYKKLLNENTDREAIKGIFSYDTAFGRGRNYRGYKSSHC